MDNVDEARIGSSSQASQFMPQITDQSCVIDRISADEVGGAIARARTREATSMDYATLAALFKEANESVADRAGDREDRSAEVDEAVSVLGELAGTESPPPMALWALGWSERERAIEPLIDSLYAAAENGNEALATRALRSVTGLSPRSLRLMYNDRNFPDLADLKEERRFQNRRYQSAIQNDLFGLGPFELFAVATGPGTLASAATSALASQLEAWPSPNNPEEFRMATHRAPEWTPDEREAVFLACLEHLAIAENPRYGVIYAVEVTRDKRAGPVLADLVRRLTIHPGSGSLYRAVLALTECGGSDHLDELRGASTHPDALIRRVAISGVQKLTGGHFWFSPNDQLHRQAEEVRFIAAIRALLSSGTAISLIEHFQDRPIELDDVPAVVTSWLQKEAGYSLETETTTVDLWPANGRQVRVSTSGEQEPLHDIVRPFGFEVRRGR